jgi:hypothetical protein
MAQDNRGLAKWFFYLSAPAFLGLMGYEHARLRSIDEERARAAAQAPPAPVQLDNFSPATLATPDREVMLEGQLDMARLVDVKDSEGRITAFVAPLYPVKAQNTSGPLKAVLVVDDQATGPQLAQWDLKTDGPFGPLVRINGRVSDNDRLRGYASDVLGQNRVTDDTAIIEGFIKGRAAAFAPQADGSLLLVGVGMALVILAVGWYLGRGRSGGSV